MQELSREGAIEAEQIQSKSYPYIVINMSFSLQEKCESSTLRFAFWEETLS